MKRDKQKAAIRRKMFFNLLLKHQVKLTSEEEEYFRQHPDEIDDITAPSNIHSLFLALGTLLGVAIIGVSKISKSLSVLDYVHADVKEFIIDTSYEMGAALLSAGVVAYLLGILLNLQSNAENWRKGIRRRILETDDVDES